MLFNFLDSYIKAKLQLSTNCVFFSKSKTMWFMSLIPKKYTYLTFVCFFLDHVFTIMGALDCDIKFWFRIKKLEFKLFNNLADFI